MKNINKLWAIILLFLIFFTLNLRKMVVKTLKCLEKTKEIEFKDYLREKLQIDKHNWNKKLESNGKSKRKLKN